MQQDYWRWPESSWRNPEVDSKAAEYITLGIDVGSVSSQAVILADGEILAYASMRAGFDDATSARRVMALALTVSGDITEGRVDYCTGTGYGRVNVPFADRSISEIACHARGAAFIYGPEVRTVLDVGGQDIKAIRCDEKGKVENFLMNDKCAAGTGRGMEVFSELLRVPVQDVGERSFAYEGEEPPAVSSTCVVYARSEALGLLRRGWTTEQVLAAYCRAMAERIYSLVERLGAVPAFAATGGMAKNRGVMERVMALIGLEPMATVWDPQIAGAAGAALFGFRLCRKGKGRRR
jgi:bzd-type benzoyl-CoA reductase Q subunit